MITSSGCNIGHGLPTQMMPQHQQVQHALRSPTDQMTHAMEKKMAGEWQNPALDHSDPQRYSFVPGPDPMDNFDSRAQVPMFSHKGDEDYHFSGIKPTTPPEKFLDLQLPEPPPISPRGEIQRAIDEFRRDKDQW